MQSEAQQPLNLLGRLSQLTESAPRRLELPRFLIISPPKTGTTWLAGNLAAHPSVAIPPEKETRFFSSSWKWCDLDWYVSRFPCDVDRVIRGEASPTYAIVPVRTIRLLQQLMPDVKLIFLMRDPVERAWSHARYTWYRKVRTFAGSEVPLASVSDAQWQAALRHDWTLASSDYVGQLERWLSVFPRSQFFIGLFDDIAARPHDLLREICSFLEIDNGPVERMPAGERTNVGAEMSPGPDLMEWLAGLYGPTALELVKWLPREVGVTPPSGWIRGAESVPRPQGALMDRIRSLAFDDDFLAETVALEERVPRPRYLGDAPAGYRLFLYNRYVFALAQGMSLDCVYTADEAALASLRERGQCFRVDTVLAARQSVTSFAATHSS
jgi:hypothetical protein